MKDKLILNLATHPLRNRRFFLSLLLLVVVLNFFFLGLTFVTAWRYSSKISGLTGSLTRLVIKKQSLEREKKQLEKKINSFQQIFTPQVERFNRLIAEKSFSWELFFQSLEKLLPDDAYVVGLNPTLNKENMELKVTLRLASFSLENLVNFTRQLAAEGCREIKVISENLEKQAQLVSEISFIYGVSSEVNQ